MWILVPTYHWGGAATSIVFVATKHVLCLDKSMLVATKTVVATNTCLLRQILVATIFFKHGFVATKHVFSRKKKSMLVATNTYLLRQINFCRDKRFVAASILLSRQKKKYFVATNTYLSRENFCRNKNDICGRSRQ